MAQNIPLQGLFAQRPKVNPAELEGLMAGQYENAEPIGIAYKGLVDALSGPRTPLSADQRAKGYIDLGRGPEVAAAQRQISGLESDPEYLADQKQAQQSADQYRQAIAQGYRGTDPVQEMAQAAKQQEMYKINAPVRAQEVSGQYDVQKQQEASRGALDVEKERQAGFEGRYDAIQQMLQGGQLGGNVRSFNPSTGAVSFGPDEKVANSILDAVTNARRQYEEINQSNPFTRYQRLPAAKSALDAAIASALAQHPADSTLKQFAQIVANDPKYNNMALPEILQEEGEDQLSPQEMNQLQQLLYIVRGK